MKPSAEEFLETKKLPLSKDMYEGYKIPYSFLVSLLNEFAALQQSDAIEFLEYAKKENYHFNLDKDQWKKNGTDEIITVQELYQKFKKEKNGH